MKLYFDTSAIIKYFHTEAGSDDVAKLVEEKNNSVWISELSLTEFISASYRKFRMGEIDSENLNTIVVAFEKKVTTWNVEPFSPLQTIEADNIIKEYGKKIGIRTLDALHLAAFNLLKQNDWKFVVADKQLNNVALAAGIATVFISG